MHLVDVGLRGIRNTPESERRRLRKDWTFGSVEHLAAPVAEQVKGDRRLAPAADDGASGECIDGVVAERLGCCDHVGQLGLGLLVDLAERGAREDVVELVAEERRPGSR